MSEYDEYKLAEDMAETIARRAISLYKQRLADLLIETKYKIFDGEAVIDGKKDPYKTGQVDTIDYVLRILGYKPFNAETGEEAEIKDD